MCIHQFKTSHVFCKKTLLCCIIGWSLLSFYTPFPLAFRTSVQLYIQNPNVDKFNHVHPTFTKLACKNSAWFCGFHRSFNRRWQNFIYFLSFTLSSTTFHVFFIKIEQILFTYLSLVQVRFSCSHLLFLFRIYRFLQDTMFSPF